MSDKCKDCGHKLLNWSDKPKSEKMMAYFCEYCPPCERDKQINILDKSYDQNRVSQLSHFKNFSAEEVTLLRILVDKEKDVITPGGYVEQGNLNYLQWLANIEYELFQLLGDF